MEKEGVLVIGGTSRQGRYTIQALLATGRFNIFGTTRAVPNAQMTKQGVTPLAFAHGDRAALDRALADSQASLVFIWTDFWGAAKGRRDVEVEHGKMIVDACAQASHVRHAVLCSVCDCDTAPEGVVHFKAKHDLELHLKQSAVPSWSILRPTTFLEAFDDPFFWNPLKKGHVKSIWRSSVRLKYVACEDIGKAAAVMFQSPEEWKGRILDCASCELDGQQLADALTEASGVPCKYSLAVPSFMVGCISRELAHMCRFFEDPGYSASIEEFKRVVPEAMDAKAFFTKLGQWHSGEQFAKGA